MKSLKLILIATLVVFASIAQAQKTFAPSDVIGDKSISKWAKGWDLKAFQQTKELYRKGMSQDDFVKAIKSNFPSKTSASFKDVFVPYFEYVYTFHAKGLTDAQVEKAITGKETTEMINGLSSWNANNPGELPEIDKFNWLKFLEFCVEIINVVIGFL